MKVNQLWSWWENLLFQKKPMRFVGVSLTNPRLPPFLFVFLLGCHHFLEEQRYQKCGFFLQFHSTTIEISYSKKTHDSHTKNRTHPQNKETRNQKKQWGGEFVSIYLCPLHVVFEMATKIHWKITLRVGSPEVWGFPWGATGEIRDVWHQAIVFGNLPLGLAGYLMQKGKTWHQKSSVPKLVVSLMAI